MYLPSCHVSRGAHVITFKNMQNSFFYFESVHPFLWYDVIKTIVWSSAHLPSQFTAMSVCYTELY